MTLFEALREDHDLQRLMLNQLVETSGDTKARTVVFGRLKSQLEAHARFEEQQLYVPMLKDDGANERARHSIAEHHEIDELIATLETTDMSSSAWLPTARTLKEKIEHHLHEEEREIVQIAGKILSEGEKISRGATYRNDMQEALAR
tara:strand:- start:54880 stop:55320 length:441 start_codon:yes stop_codon:yes gene_type:complete